MILRHNRERNISNRTLQQGLGSDLEVDLASVQPASQQSLLISPQGASPPLPTLAKPRQGKHTRHRQSWGNHCCLLHLSLLDLLLLLLLQLLLLELQLLKLLLLQHELLISSRIPPSVEGEVLLRFHNSRSWVGAVFHGYSFLRKIVVRVCEFKIRNTAPLPSVTQ